MFSTTGFILLFKDAFVAIQLFSLQPAFVNQNGAWRMLSCLRIIFHSCSLAAEISDKLAPHPYNRWFKSMKNSWKGTGNKYMSSIDLLTPDVYS